VDEYSNMNEIQMLLHSAEICAGFSDFIIVMVCDSMATILLWLFPFPDVE
jgi:hypothetical protein